MHSEYYQITKEAADRINEAKKNGEKQVYVNNVGKITDVISQKNSVSGNDVYLSIDIKLQEATYKLLEQEIAGIVYSKIKSGEIPITDVYFEYEK